MNDSQRPARELDEECSIERVKSAIDGDEMKAQMDDACRRAIPLCESGQISPFAMTLIGTCWRAAEEGLTQRQAKAEFVRSHDGSGIMASSWDTAVCSLSEHNLLPW